VGEASCGVSESSRAAPVSSGSDVQACRPADIGGNELFTTAASLEICQRDQASRLRTASGNVVARSTQHSFGGVTKRSALLTPKFSCWLDPQSDFGFRPNAV
jgi:hypothetical protein